MSEKYIGVVYKGETVLFPAPSAPGYGHGPKYCVLLTGGKVYFQFKDKEDRVEASTLTLTDVVCFVKRGDWAEFSASPFLPVNRGNVPSTTPYGGCP